jgi:signal transduction histidine kinase
MAVLGARLNFLQSNTEENTMNRRTAFTLSAVALLCGGVSLSGAALAQQFGSAADAKAMLTKTVAALKADKAKTLDLINKGEGGFLDRDIYPFCFNISDGKNVAVASPNAKQFLGKDIRENKDATGKAYGLELFAAAKDGQITEVSYMFPKAGADKTPVAKVSFVTAAGDLGCGVGYYK